MSASHAPLFGYRPGSSIVHRAPVGVKFVTLLAVTVAVFSGPIALLACITALLPVAAALGGLKCGGRLEAAKFLAWWILFIAFFRIAGKPFEAPVILAELRETGLYAWRLAAVMLAGTLFYETTSGLEIRDAFARAEDSANRLLAAFHRLVPGSRSRKAPLVPEFAFMLSLTIVFIPRVFETWSGLSRAWRARGGTDRGFRGAFAKLTKLLPLLFLRLLALASDTDRAIRNRAR